jgi:hypothetical protein
MSKKPKSQKKVSLTQMMVKGNKVTSSNSTTKKAEQPKKVVPFKTKVVDSKEVTKEVVKKEVSIADILKGKKLDKVPRSKSNNGAKPVLFKKPEPKILSDGEQRTANFKASLQKNFTNILGTRLAKEISNDVAYKIFKESFDSMVDFVLTEKENILPLSGVGTFRINMTPPRKPVMGHTSPLEQFDNIPRLKWKPSDRYRRYLLKQILGYEAEK